MGEIGGAKGRGKSPLKNGGAAAKCVLGGISSGIKKEVETFLVHVSLSFPTATLAREKNSVSISRQARASWLSAADSKE